MIFLVNLEVIKPFGVNNINYLKQVGQTPEELEEKKETDPEEAPKRVEWKHVWFLEDFCTMFSR